MKKRCYESRSTRSMIHLPRKMKTIMLDNPESFTCRKGRRGNCNHLLNSNRPDKASASALASWKHYWFKSASFVTVTNLSELWTFLIMSKFNYFLLSILILDIKLPRKLTSQILRNDTCSAHSRECFCFFFPSCRILNCVKASRL